MYSKKLFITVLVIFSFFNIVLFTNTGFADFPDIPRPEPPRPKPVPTPEPKPQPGGAYTDFTNISLLGAQSTNISTEPNETINLFTGSVSLSYKEISVPIAQNLNLEFIRSYSSYPYLNNQHSDYDRGNYWNLIHPGWRFDSGYIVTQAKCEDKKYDTCNPIYIAADGKSQKLIPLDNSLDAQNKFYKTSLNWQAESQGNSGFIMTDTSGLKYYFDHIQNIGKFNINLTYRYYLTKIETPDHNWVKYHYDQIYLKRISSSDPNKSIDINYTIDGRRHEGKHYYAQFPVQVLYNNRPIVQYIHYSYRMHKFDQDIMPLINATYANGRSYNYAYTWYNIESLSNPYLTLGSVAHSNGDVSTYSYKLVQGPYTGLLQLTSKIIQTSANSNTSSGTWLFQYEQGQDIDSLITEKTTVIGPSNTAITWFSDYQDNYAWQAGLPIRHELYSDNKLLQQETYTWGKAHFANQERLSGYINTHNGIDSATYVARLTHKNINLDGVDFDSDYSDFDRYNRPLTIKEQSGNNTRVTNLEYNINASRNIIDNISKKTINNKKIIEREYDDYGHVISDKQYGIATKYSYDSQGYKTSETDALGNTTLFGDYNGTIAQLITNPDGTILTKTVDNNGNVISSTDKNTNTTYFDYNQLGQEIYMQLPKGKPRYTKYTDFTKQQVQANLEISNQYNILGQVIKYTQIDTDNHITRTRHYKYDILGRKIFESYPTSDVTLNSANGHYYAYDGLDRLTKVCQPDASSNCIEYNYRSSNNVTITMPNGEAKSYYYQAYNIQEKPELVKVSEPYRDTLIEHDSLGNVIKIKQGSMLKEYFYNNHNQLIKTKFPETGVIEFKYDPIGNLLQKTLNNKHTIKYKYDSRNYNLLEKSYSDETPQSKFYYDSNGSLIRTLFGLTETEYKYNSNNQLISETVFVTDKKNITTEFNFKYDYNDLNILNKIIYPDGFSLVTEPNAFGEATKLSQYIHNLSYHPNGQWEQQQLKNGVVYSSSLDNLMRPDRYDAKGISYQYSYDSNNNLTRVTTSDNYHQELAFNYDQQGRIKSSTGPWGESSYEYDSNDNITKLVYSKHKNKQQNFNYTANGQLQYLNIWENGKDITSKNWFGNPIKWNYDDRGNLIADDVNYYSYDLEGNMIGIDGRVSESYEFDAFNHRLAKHTSKGDIYSIYNKEGQELLELDATTGDYKKFVYLNGKKAVQITSKNKGVDSDNDVSVGYFFYDSIGSPVMMFDEAGKIKWREVYMPFGERFNYQKNKNSDKINKHWYTGKEQDASGLSYFGARFYNHSIGRFLSPDPADVIPEKPETFNRYSYANNNPYKYVDPDGRFPIHILVSIGVSAVSSAIVAWAGGESTRDVLKAAVLGGIGGAVSSFGGSSLLSSVVRGGMFSSAQSMGYKAWTGNSGAITTESIMHDFTIGAILGFSGNKFSSTMVPNKNLPGCNGTYTNYIQQSIRQLSRTNSEIVDKPKRFGYSMAHSLVVGTTIGAIDANIDKDFINRFFGTTSSVNNSEDYSDEYHY